jgi:hypothetical protein
MPIRDVLALVITIVPNREDHLIPCATTKCEHNHGIVLFQNGIDLGNTIPSQPDPEEDDNTEH